MSIINQYCLQPVPRAGSSAAAVLVMLLLASAVVPTAVAGVVQQHGHTHTHSHTQHQHGQDHKSESQLSSTLDMLEQQRNTLAADPDNGELAVDLGNRYLELARSSDDPRYLSTAHAVLAPWHNAQQVPAPVLLLRATLKQFEHQFAPALEDLQRYLEQAPNDPQAWLTKALIHQVQGDYQLALRSCAHLSGSLKASCRAGSLSLTGAAPAAYAKLLNSVSANDRPQGGDEKIWLLSVLADTALRAGDAAKAEKHFKTLLLLQAQNTQALVGYADLLLEQRRFAEVQTLLHKHAGVDVLALRLASAQIPLKADGAATLVAELKQRVASDVVLERGVHLREAAYYLLYLANKPEQALPLALRNIQSQREPCDIQLVLEAALVTGDARAAQPLLAWIKTSRHTDQRISRFITQLEVTQSSQTVAGSSLALTNP